MHRTAAALLTLVIGCSKTSEPAGEATPAPTATPSPSGQQPLANPCKTDEAWLFGCRLAETGDHAVNVCTKATDVTVTVKSKDLSATKQAGGAEMSKAFKLHAESKQPDPFVGGLVFEHEGVEWMVYTDGKNAHGVRRFADASGMPCVGTVKNKLYLLETLMLPAR